MLYGGFKTIDLEGIAKQNIPISYQQRVKKIPNLVNESSSL